MAIVKKTGFAGGAIVDGVQILATSASFTRDRTIPYMNMLSVPPTYSGGVSRSRVAFADGVHIVNGSVAFDLTSEFMPKLAISSFLQRGYRFPIVVNDGEKEHYIKRDAPGDLQPCIWTSLSLAGSAAGLITMTISFMAAKDWVENLGVPEIDYERDQVPYGYWYSGNVDVRDWTLNVNQEVTAVYTNQDTVWPKYFKVGLWDASLEVTTYEAQSHDEVIIATKSFTITGNTASEGYNFGGQTDIGSYTHSFQSGTVIDSGLSSAIDIISIGT